MFSQCRQLTCLDLTGCRLEAQHADVAQQIIAACPHLTRLRLDDIRFHLHLDQLVGLPRLRHLSLASCFVGVDAPRLTRLFDGIGPQLRSLNLMYTLSTTGLSVEWLRQCSQLEELSVYGIAVWCVSLHSTLTTLTAGNAWVIRDECLGVLARHCTTIRRLDLGQCTHISDQGVPFTSIRMYA